MTDNTEHALLVTIERALNALSRHGSRPIVKYGAVMTDHGYVLPNPATGTWEAKLKLSGGPATELEIM